MTVALVSNLPNSPSLLAQYAGARVGQHVRRNMLRRMVSSLPGSLINKDIELINCVVVHRICV